jgi:hypothetical protein
MTVFQGGRSPPGSTVFAVLAKDDDRSSDVNLKHLVRGRTNGTTPLAIADHKEVIMSPIDALKLEAVALRAKEKASGRVLKHCDALERVAKNYGYANWRACCAILDAASQAVYSPPTDKVQVHDNGMKRYKSSEWNFALDIPERWNSFPPVLTNSPYEVTRFASHEDGIHVLIIFRQPYDPKKALKGHSEMVQQFLASQGFGNFVTSETTIGSEKALMLDFDKPQGDGTWSCRQYSAVKGTLVFTLGFGTNNRAGMFNLYDRMANTFEIMAEPPSSPEGTGA